MIPSYLETPANTSTSQSCIDKLGFLSKMELFLLMFPPCGVWNAWHWARRLNGSYLHARSALFWCHRVVMYTLPGNTHTHTLTHTLSLWGPLPIPLHSFYHDSELGIKTAISQASMLRADNMHSTQSLHVSISEQVDGSCWVSSTVSGMVAPETIGPIAKELVEFKLNWFFFPVAHFGFWGTAFQGCWDVRDRNREISIPQRDFMCPTDTHTVCRGKKIKKLSSQEGNTFLWSSDSLPVPWFPHP